MNNIVIQENEVHFYNPRTNYHYSISRFTKNLTKFYWVSNVGELGDILEVSCYSDFSYYKIIGKEVGASQAKICEQITPLEACIELERIHHE